MSEIPEIEALREAGWRGPSGPSDAVYVYVAESAIRTALDRQAREIVEALRLQARLEDDRLLRDATVTRSIEKCADLVEFRFAPKEADPR